MGTAAIQAQTSVVTERSEATDLDILPLAFAQPASLEVPLDTTAEVPTVTATTVVSNCLSEGDAVSAGGEAVLTIILRPLPSTAPASLDSDSCTGEGRSSALIGHRMPRKIGCFCLQFVCRTYTGSKSIHLLSLGLSDRRLQLTS